MMHRGTHDSPLIPSTVERLIGDPHFRETLKDTLGSLTFDLVIATYGRIRYIAEEMIGRTGRFIAIGGPPSYRGMFATDANYPPGMPIPTPEDAPARPNRGGVPFRVSDQADRGHRFRMSRSQRFLRDDVSIPGRLRSRTTRCLHLVGDGTGTRRSASHSAAGRRDGLGDQGIRP